MKRTINKYTVLDTHVELYIESKNGKHGVVLIDKDDALMCKRYTWYINNNGYAIATHNFGNSKQKTIRMHRYLLENELLDNHKMQVDHINRNRLDNRRNNLRLATPSQNSINRIKRNQDENKVKGVNWHKGKCKWCAQININGKQRQVGQFDNYEEAVLARKEAEKRYYGDYLPM